MSGWVSGWVGEWVSGCSVEESAHRPVELSHMKLSECVYPLVVHNEPTRPAVAGFNKSTHSSK